MMETLHSFYNVKSLDPGEVPQVAVTGSILCQFHKQSISLLDLALCELFIGAFFFAMRSCEYIQVSGQRKTKLLALRNIRFFIGNKPLHHGSNSLHLADKVSITFEFLKRDTKNDMKIWGKIVHRIYQYISSNPNTTVNTYRFEDGSLLLFTGTQLLKRLQLAASTIGPDSLGFTADKICLHSACSGAAMAMYLAGVPVFTIMLLGRWSSDAFLRYIRKQVKEFSTGISQKMIIHEHFFTVPTCSIEDPRNENHPLNHSSQQIHGRNFKDAIMPLVSVFH